MRRLILCAVAFLLSFIVLQAALSYFFPSPRTMMGGLQAQDIDNTIIALAGAAIVSAAAYSMGGRAAPAGKKDIDIVKKALSDDEKAVLDEVEKAGVITQDSLRFRLDWSKAKVSTIVSGLDRRGIVQRERSGKTYRVFLQKDLRG
jgi:uncharacterized membrane protein